MALTKLDPSVIGQDSTGASKITSAGGSVSIDSTGNVRIANSTANSVTVVANGFIGVGTSTPTSLITAAGAIQIQQDAGSNNRLVLRGQPGSSYRLNVDNYGTSNDLRIFRENDADASNGSVLATLGATGNLSIGGTLTTTSRGITRSSLPAGSIIQTQYVSSGTRVATSYVNTFTEPSTDYRVTITPTSTNSMIIVHYYIPLNQNSAANILTTLRSFRSIGGTKSYALTSAGNTNGSRQVIAGGVFRPQNGYDTNDMDMKSWQVIDFPNTTSAVSYGFESKPEGTNTTYWGYSAGDNGTWGWDSDIVIIAHEVAQ